MSKVTQVDFVPREMVSYSKETQTPTEAVTTHAEQKAGATQTLNACFPNLLPELNKKLSHICV